MSLQLKITLNNSKPPIWRRMVVPDTFNFHQLHLVIQAVMGWENAHFFAFRHPGVKEDIGIPDPEWDNGRTVDAKKKKVINELLVEKQKMTYEYDFGDGWQHTIILEKIHEEKILNPICLTGKCACPPEDCGGIWAYDELVNKINDPDYPDHQECMDWLGFEKGQTWDVAAFDLSECNERVRNYHDFDHE